jgi:putative nucleotidyltransferase with HDIG domain
MNTNRQRKLLHRIESAAPGSAASRAHQQHTRREHLAAWTTLFFVVVVLTVCVSPNIFQTVPSPRVGVPWPYAEVTTPYKITVPDVTAAESRRKRLEADHLKVFVENENLESEITRRADSLLTFLADVPSTLTADSIRLQVRKKFGLDLKDSTLRALAENAEISRTSRDLEVIFHHLLGVRGVSADKSLLNSALRSNRALVVTHDGHTITSQSLRMVLNYPDEAFSYAEGSYLQTFQVSPEVRAAYADLARQMLKPNINYDPVQTEQRLKQALSAIAPQRVLEPGAVVIRNGEITTPENVAMLRLLAERERQNDLLRVIGGAIVVLMASVFTLLYARRFNSDLQFNPRSVLMVALPVVLAVSLGRVIINLGGGMLLGAFAMPAGMVGILTMMLFDERFALVLTTMACALFAVSTGLAFPYTLIGIVGGYTAIASLRNLQERREVLFTGLYVALANCLMALAIGLIMNPSRPDLSAGMIAAVVNGMVCYMLAVAALPIFENIFQVTTDVRLLELTGAHHKLLQLMEERAPGTLHHSMNVASLAEAAAEAVGAHYLLVRAGAYFHDIGKMIKPTYFTENQSSPEQKQIHSKLSPAMSTLIIKNHIKEGVELARAHRLPEKVIDFIPEHHGTTLIKYFYVQALKKAEQEGSDEIISEDEYRYPGPKPRSVETAILMLADSVEAIATSRFSGKNPDEVEIRRAVHEAVADKYEDRQLSDSPLTFRDLEIIKDAFVRGLQNRFHQRVKYPTMPGKTQPAPAEGRPAAKGKPAGAVA